MKRIGLLGCGKLGGVIADALLSGAVPGCELAVIHARSPESARRLSQRYPCPIAASMDALAQQQPDYVMEAASPQAVWAFAPRILSFADLIVLSTSALGDPTFRRDMERLAEAADRHIYLAHGVIGGLDIAGAAAMMGGVSASLTKRKPPAGSSRSDAALDALADRFSGTAEDAQRLYPHLLNVGVSLGMAVGDPAAVQVRVEPGDCVDFTVDCSGAFGQGRFYTRLGSSGPELAAWSALAMLKRLTSRITF